MNKLLALLFICSVANAAYVPGTPGGAWTDEELIITKGKLHWIMDHPREALELTPGGPEAQARYSRKIPGNVNMDEISITPEMSKIVRLNFHDCVPQKNGEGCNGCLNFHGMGNIYPHRCQIDGSCTDVAQGYPFPKNGKETDNNNLQWVGNVLEELYKNPKFGPADYNQHFEVSLYDSGKSRADLWAYAGLVALQKGAQLSDRKCSLKCDRLVNGDEQLPCGYDYPFTEFKSGRSDCISDCPDLSPFCTMEPEAHPNPLGNGKDTTDYFKDNFGFTAKETIALMGVHTLGRPHEKNSMFRRYGWKAGYFKVLDNFYYINMVNRTGWRHDSSGVPDANGGCIESRYKGDEYGNVFENSLDFRVRSEMKTPEHGPFGWLLAGPECNQHICKDIADSGKPFSPNSCCRAIEPCDTSDDKICGRFKGCPDEDPTCENTITFYNIGMMSVDIGLHRKFTPDETGRPMGCAGLESDEKWLANINFKRGVPPISQPTECPLNTDMTEDNEPMHVVVERYAEDSQLWIDDFVKIYGKVLEKGYSEGQLTPSPNKWFEATKRRGKWQAKRVLRKPKN